MIFLFGLAHYRPKDATVQEYGAAWKKHRGEAKTSISNDEIEGALSQEGNVDDGRPIPRKLCQLITNALAFHEVSHINDEGIFLAEVGNNCAFFWCCADSACFYS